MPDRVFFRKSRSVIGRNSEKEKHMNLHSNIRTKLLLILPTLIFFIAYTLYPLIDGLRMSFFYIPYLAKGPGTTFVGIKNYINIFNDEIFWRALSNNFIILFVKLLVLLPCSYLIGNLFCAKYRGGELVKLFTFLPYILSGVMAGLLWTFILDPVTGLLNGFLRAIGLEELAFKWIGGQVLTPYSVAIVESWKGIGYYSVLFMSGLKMIPQEMFDAAAIDGASTLQRSIYIKIPLLKETIKIVLVLIIIGALKSYELVYIMTAGGPNKVSHTLATYIYYQNFNLGGSAGNAAAMSSIMFIIIMTLSIATLNFSKKSVDE